MRPHVLITACARALTPPRAPTRSHAHHAPQYYNLAAWHAKEMERGRKKKSTAAVERSSFDDEADRSREIRRAQQQRSEGFVKVMAANMKPDEGLVEEMREQEQQRFKMRAAYALGDTETARELASTLDPARVTADDLRAKFGSYAPSISGAKK